MIVYDAETEWLSGRDRVLDSRSRVYGLEPHRGHCVVSLSKTLYSLLNTGLTQEDPSDMTEIVDWDVKNPNS